MNFKRNLKFMACAFLLCAGTASGAVPTPPAPAAPHFPPAFEDPDDVVMPDPDLWHRIRRGFLMDPLETPLIAEHEAWYSSRPDYIKRFVGRGSRYLHHIVEQVEKRGMPMEIALLPVVESAFNPHANSTAKASGLWQFIPSTGKSYGLSQDYWKDNRRDVVAATDAALNYLQRLHGMFGDWSLALAAYNCGEGCVGRAIAWNQKRGLPTDFLSLRLPQETRNYVPKLVAVKNIVLSPAAYGIELESVPDQAYFTTVPAPERIDMRLAARLAGVSEEEFAALNPAHNKPVAIAPSGHFVLPADKAGAFLLNLEQYDQPLVTWTTVQGKKGDSTDAIAKRYGLTGAALRSLNNLQVNKRGRLTAAQPILVPGRGHTSAAVMVASNAPVTLPAARAPVPAPVAVKIASSKASAAPRTYVVRPGDTLFSIAQKFGSALDEVLRVNRLTARSVIQPGLKLNLP